MKKTGILKYIANSDAKGIKLEEEPNTWYNPKDAAAKKTIKDSYKGQKVVLAITDKNIFSSMELFVDEEIKVTEEVVSPDDRVGQLLEDAEVVVEGSDLPKQDLLSETYEEEKVSPQTPLPKEGSHADPLDFIQEAISKMNIYEKLSAIQCALHSPKNKNTLRD